MKKDSRLERAGVNMAKQRYSQEYFIEMCQAVADKVKW
jgi:hypothetical protein